MTSSRVVVGPVEPVVVAAEREADVQVRRGEGALEAVTYSIAMKTLLSNLMAALGLVALTGCATPMPVLTDFTEIKAEVRVPYDEFGGPPYEESRIAADPVGSEHCESLGKKAVFVSGRTEITGANTSVTPVQGEAQLRS